MKFFLFLAKIVAPPLLKLYRSSLSIKICHRHFVQGCHRRGEQIIYTVWHENMILGLLVHENQGVYVLVSQHFDGEIIAIILKAFGLYLLVKVYVSSLDNMMFGVIVCPRCNHVKSVNLSSMTTKCIRCGKTLQIKKLKIFYETESQEKLRKAIGLLNAEFQKKK